MSEAYAEWLVKRKTDILSVVLKIVMAVLCLFSFLLAMTPVLGIFGMLVFLVTAVLTYFVFRNSEVEYEYLYVGNQLSIDRIFGKSKRKKAWECTMDQVEIIAPSNALQLRDYEAPGMKILDFSSRRPSSRTFTLICRSGSAAARVVLEPDAKMLHLFKMTAPRKVIESI